MAHMGHFVVFVLQRREIAAEYITRIMSLIGNCLDQRVQLFRTGRPIFFFQRIHTGLHVQKLLLNNLLSHII